MGPAPLPLAWQRAPLADTRRAGPTRLHAEPEGRGTNSNTQVRAQCVVLHAAALLYRGRGRSYHCSPNRKAALVGGSSSCINCPGAHYSREHLQGMLLTNTESVQGEAPSIQPPTSSGSPSAAQAAQPSTSQGGPVIAAGTILGTVAAFAASRVFSAGPSIATLEQISVPLDVALTNGKPTVMEFYASWSVGASSQRVGIVHVL